MTEQINAMFLLVDNFKTIGMLLMLTDEFATFFTTKIDTLRNDLLVQYKNEGS